MKGVKLLTTCLAGVLAGTWMALADSSESNNSSDEIGWTHVFIRPMERLSYDKLIGRWYVVELEELSRSEDPIICVWYDFWRDGTEVSVRRTKKSANGTTVESPAATVEFGGAWRYPTWLGQHVMQSVVAMSGDGRLMSVLEGSFFRLLHVLVKEQRKATAAELEDIHRLVLERGLAVSNNTAALDPAHC